MVKLSSYVCGATLVAACQQNPATDPRSSTGPNPTIAPPPTTATTQPTTVDAPPAQPMPPSWHWENPQPQGEVLNAVLATSATEAFAVGRSGTILHTRDGGATWILRPSGTPGELTAIVAVGPRELCAVGNYVTTYSSDGGETWTATKSDVLLSGVWASGPEHVHAVGFKGQILRSNDGGRTWTKQTSGVDASLRAVWGSGPGDIYAAGEAGTLLHSTDGKTWTSLQTGATGHLWAISGSGPNDVFVVGRDSSLLHSTDAGKSWTTTTVTLRTREANEEEKLSGIEGPVPVEEDLRGVWRAAPGDLYALSDNQVLRSADDGKTWQVAHLAADKRRDGYLTDIAGDGSNHLHVVGDGGTLLHSSDRGGTWSRHDRGPAEDLRAVWGSGPGDVYAVGDNGLIMHSDGTTWTVHYTGDKDQDLVDVRGDTTGDVYATGGRATILRSSDHGASWTKQTFESTGFGTVHDLQAGGPGELLASTGDATLRTTDRGATWIVQPRAKEWFTGALWWANPTEAFGASGKGIYHSADAGKTWTRQPGTTGENINDVWGSSPDDIYIAGRHGVLLHTTDGGKTWASLEVITKFHGSINAVWGRAANDVYAVGDGGTILHTTDRGITWQREQTPTEHELFGIWGSGPRDLHVVGANGTLLHFR